MAYVYKRLCITGRCLNRVTSGKVCDACLADPEYRKRMQWNYDYAWVERMVGLGNNQRQEILDEVVDVSFED